MFWNSIKIGKKSQTVELAYVIGNRIFSFFYNKTLTTIAAKIAGFASNEWLSFYELNMFYRLCVVGRKCLKSYETVNGK